jgi:hypothetical protein
VTRAKKGVIVLNSLTIDQISNEGEREKNERYYVWQYLRYAQAVADNDTDEINSVLNQLNPARASQNRGVGHATESPFEDEIKEYIESLGYCVDCQIGEAGFRIDLGVKLRAEDADYMCGVECDGATYHTGWTARTNDIWRQDILESKGWKILRVWSTHWFDNPTDTKAKLKQELEDIAAPLCWDEAVQGDDELLSESIIETVPDETIPIETTKPQRDFTGNKLPQVTIGDTVDYIYIETGKKAKAKIIRGITDVESGLLNFNSPLASALLGAEVGDEVEFTSPRGTQILRVVAINGVEID